MTTTIAQGIKLTRKNDGEISSITFDYKRYGAMLHDFFKPQGISIPSDDVPNVETIKAFEELKNNKELKRYTDLF
ncbi:MAG: hypothetical protein LBR67_05250 [Dysgonamonadaceae bacterium]|jgi:hypothetical protein|nr:hypothetical protein [Dysgonamonadaceae bacterium]